MIFNKAKKHQKKKKQQTNHPTYKTRRKPQPKKPLCWNFESVEAQTEGRVRKAFHPSPNAKFKTNPRSWANNQPNKTTTQTSGVLTSVKLQFLKIAILEILRVGKCPTKKAGSLWPLLSCSSTNLNIWWQVTEDRAVTYIVTAWYPLIYR